MCISVVRESLVYKSVKPFINERVPMVHEGRKATRMALKSQTFHLHGQPETIFNVMYNRETRCHAGDFCKVSDFY